MGILSLFREKKKNMEPATRQPAPTPLELINRFSEAPSTPATPAAARPAKVEVACAGPVLTSAIRRYKVKGTNPATGKRKTEEMLIGEWEHKDTVIPDRTYLLPPYELSDCTALPTDAQLDVFRRNGVDIRPGMSRRDASAVVGHIIGDNTFRNDLRDSEYGYAPIEAYPNALPVSFLQLAVDNRIELSKYYTREEAKNILKASLPRSFSKQINSL